jgi:hypothetical protein
LAATGEYSSRSEVARILCETDARLRLVAERAARGEDPFAPDDLPPIECGTVRAMEQRLRRIKIGGDSGRNIDQRYFK